MPRISCWSIRADGRGGDGTGPTHLSHRAAAPDGRDPQLHHKPATCQYVSTDPEKLAARIVNAVQAQLRAQLSRLPLDQALLRSAELATAVLADETLKGIMFRYL